MFRLFSGHEWSVGDSAEKPEIGREAEGRYLVSGSKNGTFTGPSPPPRPVSVPGGRGRSVDAAMRKVALLEAGNPMTTSDERRKKRASRARYSCIFCP